MKYVSFIRGINVSGKNVVKMTELRSHLKEFGLDDVKTYIQSGNIICNSKSKSEEVTELIKTVLNHSFSVNTPVITVDLTYLQRVMDANPYKNEEPKKVAIGFLNRTPEMIELPGINDEKFTIGNSCIYLYYPGGMGKSKLSNAIIERKMEVISTMRNWNTCRKVVDLMID